MALDLSNIVTNNGSKVMFHFENEEDRKVLDDSYSQDELLSYIREQIDHKAQRVDFGPGTTLHMMVGSDGVGRLITQAKYENWEKDPHWKHAGPGLRDLLSILAMGDMMDIQGLLSRLDERLGNIDQESEPIRTAKAITHLNENLAFVETMAHSKIGFHFEDEVDACYIDQNFPTAALIQDLVSSLLKDWGERFTDSGTGVHVMVRAGKFIDNILNDAGFSEWEKAEVKDWHHTPPPDMNKVVSRKGAPIVLHFELDRDKDALLTSPSHPDFNEAINRALDGWFRNHDLIDDGIKTLHVMVGEDTLIVDVLDDAGFSEWEKAEVKDWHHLIRPTMEQFLRYMNNRAALEAHNAGDGEICELCPSPHCGSRNASFDEEKLKLAIAQA